MDENEIEEKKDIEIVTGDGSDLDISPVYEHLNAAKPKSLEKKEKDIVIPKESKSKQEDLNKDEDKKE